MSRHTRNGPPTTLDPEAAALVARAIARCSECRKNWRLKPDSFVHRAAPNIECSAKTERLALRELNQS